MAQNTQYAANLRNGSIGASIFSPRPCSKETKHVFAGRVLRHLQRMRRTCFFAVFSSTPNPLNAPASLPAAPPRGITDSTLPRRVSRGVLRGVGLRPRAGGGAESVLQDWSLCDIHVWMGRRIGFPPGSRGRAEGWHGVRRRAGVHVGTQALGVKPASSFLRALAAARVVLCLLAGRVLDHRGVGLCRDLLVAVCARCRAREKARML